MNTFQLILSRAASSYDFRASNSNTINFFICSAFEDFEVERRILYLNTFPKLRDECFAKFGIEINLIDLKLGIDPTHEVTNTFHNLFTEYIEKHGICDQNNCPIFLFGQRYGRPLVPLRIPIGIFELFKKTLRRYKNRFSVDPSILDQYYKVDSNVIEPIMVLVDPKDVLPNLTSKDTETIKESLQQWTLINFLLSDLIKGLSNICLHNESLDLITVQHLLTFELDATVSVTLRRSLDSSFLPIIFSRQIIDIKNFITISNESKNDKRKLMIQKLIDVVFDGQQKIVIDENVQVLLNQLMESCVEIYDSVDPPFKILWRDDTGVNEDHHNTYIEEMMAFFNTKIYEAVNERADFLLNNMRPNLLKCVDIVCDTKLQVKRLAKLAYGFEDIVSALLAYVSDDSETSPMVLFGPVNSGKSIVLSKTIYEVLRTNNDARHCHLITRFVTSDHCWEDILMSIFYQMSAIALHQHQFETIVSNSTEIDRSIPKDLEGILMSFQHATSVNFIIILHDLEKCFTSDLAFDIEKILPKMLPENIKVILSTTSKWEDRQLDLLNLSVPEFSVTEYNTFIQTQLNSFGKKLNESQSEFILKPYLKQIRGIFEANLATDILKRYRSFDIVNDEVEHQERKDLVVEILKINFQKYGEVVISHIIYLLYCSKGGLVDQEITDLLSMDNDVVQESKSLNPSFLIIHHDNIKFSFAIWLLIRNDLSVLLVEKMRDGYILVDLTNESVLESLQTLKGDINTSFFSNLFSEYYLGLWYGKKKPFYDNGKNENFHNCLPKQQKMFLKDGAKIFYNYRKLRQLVHHLVDAKMNEKLLDEVIFNFDWLYYKIKALGINELLDDFKYARNGSKEIILLEESIRNSAAIVDKDLDSLAGELIGQLLPYVSYYPNLRFLIENCDTVAPKHNAFIPIYANDKLPGSPLASTISCPAAIESVEIVKNQITQNDELLLKVKGDCHIYFYDLILGVIVSNTLVSHGIVYFGDNTDIIFILESKFRQVIKIHRRATGDLLGQIIPMNWVVPRPFENKQEYKITKIDIGKTKAALLVTNEVSYLFIVNLETFEPILAFNPGVKLQMLKLGKDESKVFSHHGEKLISFEISTNKPNSAVELQGNPVQMIFSLEKFNKAFIICEEQRGVVVLELDKYGGVNKCYKISFDNCLNNDDFVKEVSCSQLGNTYLLIRSAHSVLLYDWKKEKVLCHVTRPVQLPVYFKLPNQHENQPASLQFNAAKLILSDRVLACSLFRDVILCGVSDNKVLTTLHAPVGGIVSEIFVTNDFLIGRVDQNEDAAEIMIWRTEISSLFSKIETLQDRLTKSVERIHVGPSVAIATCENSDEMGVIEVSTGTLVDLYSHASKVLNSCLSICGKFALVTVDNNQNSNILWSLESRRIILEFGNSLNTSFIVQLESLSGFLCISNYSTSIDNPQVTITQIICDDSFEGNGGYSMSRLEVDNVSFICDKPCILNDDRILAVLSNHYEKKDSFVQCNCLITVWTRESNCSENGFSKTVTNKDLSDQIGKSVINILSMNTTTHRNSNVIIMCHFEEMCPGSLILDCVSNVVLQYIDLIKSLPQTLDIKNVFLSNSGNYLFDQGTLCTIDMNTGDFIGSLSFKESSVGYRFQCFALRDTILVLSQEYKLLAWRLPVFEKIGQVELKDEITHVSKCADDFTLLVGCQDGYVLSYAIVDVFSPHSNLREIKVVRNFRPMSKSPTIQLESTDILKNVSTKASLEFDIKPVQRPMSDPTISLERRGFSPLF